MKMFNKPGEMTILVSLPVITYTAPPTTMVTRHPGNQINDSDQWSVNNDTRTAVGNLRAGVMTKVSMY